MRTTDILSSKNVSSVQKISIKQKFTSIENIGSDQGSFSRSESKIWSTKTTPGPAPSKFNLGKKPQIPPEPSPDKPIDPKKATDDFLSIMASRLCLLDNEISMSEQDRGKPIDTNDKKLKKLKKSYFYLLKSFSKVEGIVDSVFVYALILTKRVKRSLMEKFEFKQKEFMLIYAGCLFLSIKYVVDCQKWFLEDFSHLSKIEEQLVHKMEIFVLETALNFKISVGEEEYSSEHHKMYRNVERRLKRAEQKGRKVKSKN
jgi:hypothetical protein